MWSKCGPGRLTTQVETKPRPHFHLNPGTPKVSYLETGWISVNLLLTLSDRIKPACTCTNEWACLCSCLHQREAVHVKSRKNRSVKPTWSQVQGQMVLFVRLTAKLAEGPRWPLTQPSTLPSMKRKWKKEIWLFLKFWVNHLPHWSKSTTRSFWF